MKPHADSAAHPLERRAAGVLLHLTSLPGPLGVGDLGPAALSFADFLRSARQQWWQMLPIGPIGPGHSPYASPSAFAGNELFVSPELLWRDGLLERHDLEEAAGGSPSRVNYDRATRLRRKLLRKAYAAATARPRRWRDRLAEFRRRCGRLWLDDYALFRAVSSVHAAPWTGWPAPLRRRQRAAIAQAQRELRAEIDFERFVQCQFDRQWRRFRTACHARGVGLIGDIPIFVDHESSDVWARQELFQLDRAGRPTVVSGCPPDYFSRTGQLWGHPHYAWKRHAADGFRWWIARFRRALELFDAVRIDHFIGLHRVWQVPGGARDARRGRYVRTPGRQLLGRARAALGRLPIIAEDLGAVTPGVWKLRDDFGLPGMRVLQFAFAGSEGARYHQPHNHPRRAVVYTGTHDNDTTAGWFAKRRAPEARRVLAYVGGAADEIHWSMLRAAYASPAALAIVPVQDLLGLGSAARMNVPSTPSGNWTWRVTAEQLSPELAQRLAAHCEACER
ncbi:MAG: 4-alpha-glucanotransferase [Phycisphaerae bacterium]|nr:4-alpha-glucanotransferase [Phycisphaerae bacterium]MCZ2400454.1 4-alpha-glucanotransferase [Phycisphaerae bacterium]